MVLTDGASNVEYWMTLSEAKLLRESGAAVIGVAIGNRVDRTELEGIATGTVVLIYIMLWH